MNEEKIKDILTRIASVVGTIGFLVLVPLTATNIMQEKDIDRLEKQIEEKNKFLQEKNYIIETILEKCGDRCYD